jgi:hypothetical protein
LDARPHHHPLLAQAAEVFRNEAAAIAALESRLDERRL